MTCWEFRPRQKYLAPQISRKHPPGPSPPPPPPAQETTGNFSSLKEKLSRRVVDTKILLKKNRKTHIYHRNLSSVAPIFFGKEKFLTGAGRCVLSFSQCHNPGPSSGTEYNEARNDYTNNSETVLLCNKCVCNRKINSQTINVCNWHVRRKYLMEAPELHKIIPARMPCVTDVLCT